MSARPHRRNITSKQKVKKNLLKQNISVENKSQALHIIRRQTKGSTDHSVSWFKMQEFGQGLKRTKSKIFPVSNQLEEKRVRFDKLRMLDFILRRKCALSSTKIKWKDESVDSAVQCFWLRPFHQSTGRETGGTAVTAGRRSLDRHSLTSTSASAGKPSSTVTTACWHHRPKG